MIAIFSNKADAEEYSDLIHTHLLANRPGYNATNWSGEVKAHGKEEYAVKIPHDLKKLKVKMKDKDLEKNIRKIEKYPIDWTPNETI